MNSYLNTITNYYNCLSKLATDVNSDLVEGIVYELSEGNEHVTSDQLITQARTLITLSTLEDFYDGIILSEDNTALVDRLGQALVEKIASMFNENPVKVSLAKGKYDHINFKPPSSVAAAAARGLELRKKAPKSHKGGLAPEEASRQGIGSGVARAVSLKNRDNLSPKVISMMVRFFARHNKNIEKAKKLKGKEKNLSKAYQASLLWGGTPGRSWANKIFRQMEAADKKSKKGKSK